MVQFYNRIETVRKVSRKKRMAETKVSTYKRRTCNSPMFLQKHFSSITHTISTTDKNTEEQIKHLAFFLSHHKKDAHKMRLYRRR